MTTRAEVARWFDEGVAQGATHMIVVCDTFDWEDYPVYAHSAAEARSKFQDYSDKSMQQVMEVYALSKPKDPQLAEHRAFHFE